MTLQQIKETIENHFKVNLQYKGRKYDLVKVRFFYYYCALTYCSEFVTFQKIGDSIGFNHATVIYGSKEFRNIYDSDPNFKYNCDLLESQMINTEPEEDIQVSIIKIDYLKRKIKHLRKELKELNVKV